MYKLVVQELISILGCEIKHADEVSFCMINVQS
jgi:hypothetical protein